MPEMTLSNWKSIRRFAPSRAIVSLCIVGLFSISSVSFVLSTTAYGQEDSFTEESLQAPENAVRLSQPKDDAPKDNTPKEFAPLSESLKRRGDLSLRDATIAGALFTISETWEVNIVVGENVTGKVSGVFRQTPLHDVLDSILLANGYSYRTVGNSLVVQRSQDVGTAHPLLQSVTLPIRHGAVKEIAEGVKLLLSEQGNVTAMESARSILIIDYADRVASVSSFVARMDAAAARALGGMPAETYKRLDVAYFPTQYISAADARESLLVVLSKVGRISVMTKENRLVVVDYPVNIEMVRKVLDRIDRPRPQVRITALIYDISLQDIEQLGLNWNSVGNTRGDNQAFTFDSQMMRPFQAGAAAGGAAAGGAAAGGAAAGGGAAGGAAAGGATGGALGGTVTFKSLTRNFDLNTVVLALQTASDARLLANPNVTVLDNETAEWKSISEIPYQQLSQSSFGGQIGTTAFKEAGITLRVRPTIAADGTIEMFIEPEFSRLAGFTPQENQPIIDSRKASTTVRIANRQTLVLGGLRQRTDTGQFNGIPLLKDLRFIGPAFRARDTNVRESELIVFIMPEIIGFDNLPTPRQSRAQETVTCKLGLIPEGEGCPDLGGSCDGQLDFEASCLSCRPTDLSPLPPVEQGMIIGRGESATNLGNLDASAAEAVIGEGVADINFAERMLIDQQALRPAYPARFRATGGTDSRRQRMFESDVPPTREAARLHRELISRKPAKKKATLWQRMFGS